MISRRKALQSFVSIPLAGWSLASLTGCTENKNPWSGASNKTKVLVSFAPIYSFTKAIAGDDAEVECLLTETGPHFHGDATSKQLTLARGCDTFIINGLKLDDDLAKKLGTSAGNPKWRVLDLGSKFDPNWLKEGICHHDEDDKHDHDHGTDPHVWLSVKHAKKMVEVIRDELKSIDAPHASNYDERTAAYLKKLDDLQTEATNIFKDIPKEQRRVVSFHDSLAYFGESFGVRIVDSIMVRPEVEPGPDRLRKITKLCQDKEVSVLTVEPQFAEKSAAQAIKSALRGDKAKPIACELASVDPLETAKSTELSADWYIKKMTENLNQLAKAFKETKK